MVKIRLRRVGARKQPYYRVVVTDSRSPRDGRFIEAIGHLDPRADPPAFVIDESRALHWLQKGAQPSPAVARLLAKQGTTDKWLRIEGGEPIEQVLAEGKISGEAGE